MEAKDSLSKARLIMLATIIICAAITSLGVGLGLWLYKRQDSLTVNTDTSSTLSTYYSTTVGPPNNDPSKSVEGHYRRAAVAADGGICSEIGTEILARRESTAVDGAIAALLCTCAYNCHSCGIGGGFFMTIYNRSANSVNVINAREMAPKDAHENMFVPKDKSSTEGGLAIGIPGEIKGMHEAWKMGGGLPWEELFIPTIKLLRNGMVVGKPLADAIAGVSVFDRHFNLKNTFTNPATGRLYVQGDTIKFPLLANTFEIISKEGPDAFYNGSLTSDIVADIQEAGGIITVEDLNNYKAVIKDPIKIKLRDNSTLYSLPPPSSGVVLQFIVNILDEYKFDNLSISTTEKASLTWHRIIEAFKFAYAKRTELGDPDGENQTFKSKLNELVKNMTSEDFARDIRSKISDDKTHGTDYYGPTFYDYTSTGTSHMSLLAPNGDAVSVTSTINLHFGSKVVGSRTGIIFNNEMDDFSTPNTTNAFGIPASPANFIKPYKRPLSSMCPSIVVDPDGHVKLVVGASGGTRITTSTALVTMETLWFGLGIKEAIDYRRLHHQLLPPEIKAEEGFPQDILNGLRSRGHNITISPSAGSVVQGILQLKEGKISANCDFRKNGYPDGF